MAQIKDILLPADKKANIETEAIELAHNADEHLVFIIQEDENDKKMGEIFKNSDKQWRFVCVHCCTNEFSQFTDFVLHTDEHLKTIAASQLEITSVSEHSSEQEFVVVLGVDDCLDVDDDVDIEIVHKVRETISIDSDSDGDHSPERDYWDDVFTSGPYNDDENLEKQDTKPSESKSNGQMDNNADRTALPAIAKNEPQIIIADSSLETLEIEDEPDECAAFSLSDISDCGG